MWPQGRRRHWHSGKTGFTLSNMHSCRPTTYPKWKGSAAQVKFFNPFDPPICLGCGVLVPLLMSATSQECPEQSPLTLNSESQWESSCLSAAPVRGLPKFSIKHNRVYKFKNPESSATVRRTYAPQCPLEATPCLSRSFRAAANITSQKNLLFCSPVQSGIGNIRPEEGVR